MGLSIILSSVCVFTDRLALIRQQREEAAKKREEEKAGINLWNTLCDAFVSQTETFLQVSDLVMFGLLQQETLRRSKGANESNHSKDLPTMCCFYFVFFYW